MDVETSRVKQLQNSKISLVSCVDGKKIRALTSCFEQLNDGSTFLNSLSILPVLGVDFFRSGASLN